MSNVDDEGSESPPNKFTTDYIKSGSFRVISPDGIFGGLTPRGKIHMSVWTERQPIPKRATYKITPDGKVGDELREERVVRDVDTVREVEVSLVLDLSLAKSVIQWLQKRIGQFDEISQGHDDSPTT